MDDLISRQAAIDALDEIESEVADGYGYQYEKWRKYFCELPSAQPEQRWIPVNKRLPETNGDYLVTGRKMAVNKRRYEDGRWYGNWDVLAWMPLPEPFRGEGGQE